MPIETHPGGSATITGNAINWFGIKVVLGAMKLYLDHGIRVNTAYTPAQMRRFASHYTGKAYGRNSLRQAHEDLLAFVQDKSPDSITR